MKWAAQRKEKKLFMDVQITLFMKRISEKEDVQSQLHSSLGST